MSERGHHHQLVHCVEKEKVGEGNVNAAAGYVSR